MAINKFTNWTKEALTEFQTKMKTWVHSVVPTKTSQLVNDSGFIKLIDIPSKEVAIDKDTMNAELVNDVLVISAKQSPQKELIYKNNAEYPYNSYLHIKSHALTKSIHEFKEIEIKFSGTMNTDRKHCLSSSAFMIDNDGVFVLRGYHYNNSNGEIWEDVTVLKSNDVGTTLSYEKEPKFKLYTSNTETGTQNGFVIFEIWGIK